MPRVVAAVGEGLKRQKSISTGMLLVLFGSVCAVGVLFMIPRSNFARRSRADSKSHFSVDMCFEYLLPALVLRDS